MHSHAVTTPASHARWILIINVILLALTAQLFREDFFGLFRPITPAPDLCNNVQCENPDRRCSNATGSCDPNTGKCMYAPTGDNLDCDWAAANLTRLDGFVCKFGECIQTTDPCVGLVCTSPADSQCQQPQGSCSDEECQYSNVPDGLSCGLKNASTCVKGACVTNASAQITSFAYDSSISTGIVSSALALEMLFVGAISVDLAAFVCTTALIAIGWTGYARDEGNYPADRALIRTQNAFVLLGASLSIIFAVKAILGTPKGKPEKLSIIAIGNVVVSAVQFALVAQLFNEHFDYLAEGEIDTNANILFNWSYTATIYAASVSISNAFAILYAGATSAGFGIFQAGTGIIALAWASNHFDVGEEGSGDFSDTLKTWVSFAVIAGAYSLIAGLILVWASKPPTTKYSVQGGILAGHRLTAIAMFAIFATLIGQVAALFDHHFLDHGRSLRGSNMLIVGNDNYGNIVSPFAWPISIWTSVIVCSFALEVLRFSVPSAGITALALTESALLLGWAAEHTYFGSAHADSIEGTTRGWQSVALGGSAVAFFFAKYLLYNQRNKADALPTTS